MDRWKEYVETFCALCLGHEKESEVEGGCMTFCDER
jgi:hypothetical protein